MVATVRFGALDRMSTPWALQVGGRSIVSSTIKQIVELRSSDDERFARLLEVLGEYGDSGKILVFVNSQDKCSTLFQQLLNYGYPNQMLHGDMQQARPRSCHVRTI
jgi:ATP-dependent RNA helicase DDX46/PRP5